ncbi:hypothetical protein [Gloeocapsopsis dulcis]|uniref:hypothetical protein n=1 Tax=Gloeocapsopsis dulcis TaxID=2859516 RepID=UPI001F20DFE5|nr:hypothetical protein [Gloeocapsopsis dulcis]WNN87675.1 hypothetical protein P0S91_15275 [Gloeocapsopsis dulcis]
MTREKSIKVRLTQKEFERIGIYAKSQGISVSEVIRDYIKRLPKTDSLRSISLLVAIHLPLNLAVVTGVLLLHLR